MRRRYAQGVGIAILIASLGAAQGPNSSEAKPAPNSAVRKPVRLHAKPYQVGTASWYGQNFQGKPTASGELYQMHDMTAAHLTLPMGSYVQVTNLRNGRSVVVRVNDRGPIVPGRIIDVSYGAAQALQFKGRGLQRVRLDVVSRPETIIAKAKPSLVNQKSAYETLAFNKPVAKLP